MKEGKIDLIEKMIEDANSERLNKTIKCFTKMSRF